MDKHFLGGARGSPPHWPQRPKFLSCLFKFLFLPVALWVGSGQLWGSKFRGQRQSRQSSPEGGVYPEAGAQQSLHFPSGVCVVLLSEPFL